MRMLMYVDLPVEPFNSLVREGKAGETIQEILAAIEPEAVPLCTTMDPVPYGASRATESWRE